MLLLSLDCYRSKMRGISRTHQRALSLYQGLPFKILPEYYKSCNLRTCAKNSLKFASDKEGRALFLEDKVPFYLYHDLKSRDFPGTLNVRLCSFIQPTLMHTSI